MSDETPANGLEAAENENKQQTVTILGKEYPLTKGLTASAAYKIGLAQREQDLAMLIEATVAMVLPSKRKQLLEAITVGPDTDDVEELSLEALNNIFADALEKVSGRPLEQ